MAETEDTKETQENSANPEAPAMDAPADAGEESFAELFEKSYTGDRQIKEGSIVKGRVIEIRPDDQVLVDIGFKSEGLVSLAEFRRSDPSATVEPGDNVEVFLERCEDDEGLCVISKEKADRLKIWDDISGAYESDSLVEGVIVARVKGGLSVDIGVKAFLPGSQVDLRPVRNLEKLIGEKYSFKIIKFNKKRGNIVLSRRVLLEKEREALKSATLEKLGEGIVLDGIVKNITEYGAFVDLGGIDGLLHITDMSWGRVNHPQDVVKVGDEIQVKVLKFDQESERVSLGMKQLSADPWEEASKKYEVGSKVEGKVVSLTDYGAFVELEEGVEGLVHISEMSWTRRIKHPSKVVAISDTVEAVVLDIDTENKRISLGMKQVEPNPWTLLSTKYPVGSIIRGRIRNITDFGIFIGIEEGIDGLVHISDISWTHRVKHPSELFSKADEVEAVVLNIDVENERFSLGVKQLIDDPWDTIPQKYPMGRVITCKVLKVGDFGAFVELEKGIEGIIETAEISPEPVEDARKVVKAGDYITAEVLNTDRGERRISLSAKAGKGIADGEQVQEYMGAETGDSMKLGSLLGDKLGNVAAVDGAASEKKPEETAEEAPAAEPAETAEEAPAAEPGDDESKPEGE